MGYVPLTLYIPEFLLPALLPVEVLNWAKVGSLTVLGEVRDSSVLVNKCHDCNLSHLTTFVYGRGNM